MSRDRLHVALLGDSAIDNGAYVGSEPDVAAQVRAALPQAHIVSHARDGSTIADVRKDQVDKLGPADLVVLSAGGNDTLLQIGLLYDEARVTMMDALAGLWSVRGAFRAAYADLLDAIAGLGKPVLVATIYTPRLEMNGAVEHVIKAAASALAFFNDAIQSEAHARGFDILETRDIFVSQHEFANSIEPAADGGAKLAEGIARWVEAARRA